MKTHPNFGPAPANSFGITQVYSPDGNPPTPADLEAFFGPNGPMEKVHTMILRDCDVPETEPQA